MDRPSCGLESPRGPVNIIRSFITGVEYKEYQKKGTIPSSVPQDAVIKLVGRPTGYTHVIEWERSNEVRPVARAR